MSSTSSLSSSHTGPNSRASSSASPSGRPHRIALLTADTPTPPVVEAYGTYVEVFQRHLHDSLGAAGRTDEIAVELEAFDVCTGAGHYPADSMFEHGRLGAFEAIMISGSGAAAYDDDSHPWMPKLIRFLRHIGDAYPHVRQVGFCFGMQIIARAYGGTVEENPAGWEIGAYALDLTPSGRDFLAASSSSSNQDVKKLQLMQMHSQHLTAVPPEGDWTVLASTERTRVAAIAKFYGENDGPGCAPGKAQMLAFQGHPEFSPELVQKVIGYQDSQGALEKQDVEEGYARAKRGEDGTGVLGGKIWEVLLGEA